MKKLKLPQGVRTKVPWFIPHGLLVLQGFSRSFVNLALTQFRYPYYVDEEDYPIIFPFDPLLRDAIGVEDVVEEKDILTGSFCLAQGKHCSVMPSATVCWFTM